MARCSRGTENVHSLGRFLATKDIFLRVARKAFIATSNKRGIAKVHSKEDNVVHSKKRGHSRGAQQGMGILVMHSKEGGILVAHSKERVFL